VLHSDLGVSDGGRDVYVGNTGLTLKRDHMEVVSPMGEDDLPQDFDILNRLWTYAIE